MKLAGIAVSVFMTLGISGCGTITLEVSPVGQIEGDEVCIIENPDVRAGFLRAFKGTLEGNGYKVKMLPFGADLTDCMVTSIYLAHWAWDIALYMSYAKIIVFQDGRPVGDVVYDALEGGIDEKFVRGDEKIAEIVNLLFPKR